MSGDGAAGAVVIVALVAGTYAYQRIRYPHRVCPTCHGEKRIKLPGTSRFRDCGRCGATGELRRGQ